MKIFHVITLAELGGAQSVVINLAKKSVEEGHEVFIISGENGTMWDVLEKEIIQIKIPEIQRSISPQKEIKVVQKLIRIYREYLPDVIHLHSSKIGILGRLAFPKSKIIYTIHGFDSIRLAFRKFLPLEKMLKNRAKFIASVSNYDTKNLKSEGIDKNVVTVYNGIEDWTKNFPEEKKRKSNKIGFLQELKDSGSFIIITIARKASPKRFDLFCNLADKMASYAHVKFVWIGNQEEENNLPANMICLGEIADAHQCLEYANLFVLFSDYEGMPMSVIEALAYSKPVIASNVGGISEILNNRNGFTVENNVEKIEDKLKDFVDKKIDYISFSKEARKTFEEKFTLDIMYKNYKDLYNKIIKNVSK